MDRVVTEDLRCLLSLLNRSRSKSMMNAHMEKLLVLKRLSLLDISKVMMRMNGVYKQASIERQSIKKKTPAALQKQGVIQEAQATEGMLDNPLMLGTNLEVVFIQQ